MKCIKRTNCVLLHFETPRNLLKINVIWDALDVSFLMKFTLKLFFLYRWVLAKTERKYNLQDYVYCNIINSRVSCVPSYCCSCLP